MESPQKQNLTLQPKESRGLRLSESKESKARLDRMMMGCFAVQKLYGRDTGNAETITEMFHAMLGKYPAAHCIRALELWLERSQEFPTPADIIGIIKRKGKQPLSKETYIAISRKDGELRDASDWQFLREYEAEQREEVSGFDDEVKNEVAVQENITLRQQVKALTAETKRLADLLHQTRVAKGLEPAKPSHAQKVAATVEAMRSGGASEEDIAAFEASQAGAA